MAKPNEVIGGLNNVESPEYRALNNVRRLEYSPPIAKFLAHRGHPGTAVPVSRAKQGRIFVQFDGVKNQG
jgi:hypothetical protein